MVRVEHKWTEAEINYLKSIKITSQTSRKDVQALMCEKFNYEFSLGQIKGMMDRLKIRISKNRKEYRPPYKWTEEEINYLKEISLGTPKEEIRKMMCEKFNYEFSKEQIKGVMGRCKIVNKRDTRLKKGNIPPNKGKKGFCAKGSEKGWFKKGSVPHNHKEIGSERVNIYGYVEIKIKEPNVWIYKNRFVYEKFHGEIPEDHVVIFADTDKMNFDINNLIAIHRRSLSHMNFKKLFNENPQLTKSGIIVADLFTKIKDMSEKCN